MKTLNLTFSFVLITLLSASFVAQPTINSDIVFQLGDSAEVSVVSEYFNPGNSGENATWDFSMISGPSRSWNWTAEDPSITVFKDSVPLANLAFNTALEEDTVENYVYYRFENDALDYLGTIGVLENQNDTIYQLLNKDPQRIFTFPFTYLDQSTDDFKGVNIVKFGNMSVVQTRTGSVTHTADATGTITTPLGTFQNVLRVKTEETIMDSTFFMGFPSITEQVITRYAWYAENEKYLIMQMDSVAILTAGFPTVTMQSQYRTEEVSVSIDENAFAAEIDLKISPNPAVDQLNISFENIKHEPIRISLHNVIGQELIQQEYMPLVGFQTHSLQLGAIGPGYYLLKISTPSGTAARKIQVQ